MWFKLDIWIYRNLFQLVMSNTRYIDGQTGELIGGYTSYEGGNTQTYQQGQYVSSTVNPTANQQYTTTTYTSGYQPVGQTYTTQQVGSSYVQGGYTTSNVQSGYVAGSNVQAHEPQVVNTVVNTGKEVIKGESRIEYVPFEKKIVEYKDQSRVERVPKTRTVTEYREEKVVE